MCFAAPVKSFFVSKKWLFWPKICQFCNLSVWKVKRPVSKKEGENSIFISIIFMVSFKKKIPFGKCIQPLNPTIVNHNYTRYSWWAVKKRLLWSSLWQIPRLAETNQLWDLNLQPSNQKLASQTHRKFISFKYCKMKLVSTPNYGTQTCTESEMSWRFNWLKRRSGSGKFSVVDLPTSVWILTVW